ncbi:hypothetical protein PVAP13_4KG298605 [Panicum virgatum]|uniref:Uncharacterized protein n=1 Tax=Panicum virgatum TaxID=38727 RepID=A0A8T0TKX2_PANVG|nr:hypothetical protein PVAP13_4KG298605 [Panicum virgatum]
MKKDPHFFLPPRSCRTPLTQSLLPRKTGPARTAAGADGGSPVEASGWGQGPARRLPRQRRVGPAQAREVPHPWPAARLSVRREAPPRPARPGNGGPCASSQHRARGAPGGLCG